MDVAHWLTNEHHGVARASTIIAKVGRAELTRLVGSHALERICHGWYAVPGSSPRVRLAVASGGSLSCISALAAEGVWVPDNRTIHVRVTGHTRRSRRARTVTECDHPGRALPTPRSVDPRGLALQVAAGCVAPDEFVAICDSLMHLGKCDRDDLHEWLKACPKALRGLVHWTDGKAESGTESLTRFRLARRGFTVRTQVGISGVGRVDLLVGRRLIIEVDSVAHHTDLQAYIEDRRRDRILVGLGFIVIRLTYHQVMYGWDDALQDILRITRRRDHLRDPRGFARAA